MGQEQDKPRSFIGRYWIVIVIVLWVIAWSARDVLAPSGEATPDADDPGAVVVAEAPEDKSREPGAAVAPERDAVQVQEAAADEAVTPGAVDPAPVAMPESADPERRTTDPAAQAAQGLLDEARAVYWNEGPAAAAERLQAGLEVLPEGSVQRADLDGELGNVLYQAGQIAEAMAAWDRALAHLPVRERRVMLQRLAPIYGRHHPDGLLHLQRFE